MTVWNNDMEVCLPCDPPLVRRRLVPDDLDKNTPTFRWTPPEFATWGKARQAAWEALPTAVRPALHEHVAQPALRARFDLRPTRPRPPARRLLVQLPRAGRARGDGRVVGCGDGRAAAPRAGAHGEGRLGRLGPLLDARVGTCTHRRAAASATRRRAATSHPSPCASLSQGRTGAQCKAAIRQGTCKIQ